MLTQDSRLFLIGFRKVFDWFFILNTQKEKEIKLMNSCCCTKIRIIFDSALHGDCRKPLNDVKYTMKKISNFD